MDKSRLCPGMILGQDVYNFANQIVIKKGTVLDERTITKLHRFEIPQFMIEEEVLSIQEANSYHRSIRNGYRTVRSLRSFRRIMTQRC